MERYYHIEENRQNKQRWDVVYGANRVIHDLESDKFAQIVADKLNDAYKCGCIHTEENVKERITSLLFNKN